MKKRFMSGLLTAAMTLSMLTGSVAVNAEDAAIDTSKEVELNVLMLSQKATDWEEVWGKINEKLKEEINATVNVEYLGWGEYQEKYPLLLTSGDSYDLVYTSNWCFYKDMVQKEMFTELTDEMVSTYMPLTWENTEDYHWNGALLDGKRYMIPFTQVEDSNRLCALVRGDLIEKYDIPDVTDMDSFLNYLYTIAGQDGEILAYNGGGSDGASQLLNALIQPKGYDASVINVFNGITYIDLKATEESGELVFVNALENEDLYKAYEEMMKLRQAGVWSQDILSNDTLLDTAMENGSSASFVKITANTMPMWSKLNATYPEWDLSVVDLTSGVDGFQQVYKSAAANGYAVPVTAKNPERALMALDLLKFDRELNDLASLGIEGVHWTAEGDDKYYTTEKSLDYPYGDGAMSYALHTQYTRSVAGYPDYIQAILDDVKANGSTPAILMFNFNPEPVKNEYAAVSAVHAEYYPILANGLSDDVEATMKECQEKMTAAGLQNVLDEMKAQYSEFVKTLQ